MEMIELFYFNFDEQNKYPTCVMMINFIITDKINAIVCWFSMNQALALKTGKIHLTGEDTKAQTPEEISLKLHN